MTIHYSVLISAEDDAVNADLSTNLVQAIVSGAKSVDGVTDVVVNQLVPGDVLYPDTVP